MGEETKNHKTDSENLQKAGIIPFKKDKYGYNPGLFLAIYMECTNSKLNRLFQKPQRKAKWFDVHDFSITTLYENKPIGGNLISKILKNICTAANLPDNWTNHCLRATGITTLKSLGFEDRAIMNLSGNIFLL